MEEKYSEDYEQLMNYVQNPTLENVVLKTAFFEKKYAPLIKKYRCQYIRFGKTSTLTHAFTDKVDFYERTGFTRDRAFFIQEDKIFRQKLSFYVARAVKNFKPDKIQNKKNYCFAPYLELWLKTGLRDIRRQNKKYLIKEIPNLHQSENSETIIEKLDNEKLMQRLTEVYSKLAPLDKKICEELSKGKKQNAIKIKNEETCNFYSVGYINKRIQAIRKKMEENGISMDNLSL